MKKQFNQLKVGDTIFLVGSPDFILHECLVENFGVFTIKNIIETLDGKRNPIVCLSGEYIEPENPTISRVAYFTALSECEISDYQANIRIDEWSKVFTKTISKYQTFLCYPDVFTGLDFIERKMKQYLEDIKESRKINSEIYGKKNDN